MNAIYFPFTTMTESLARDLYGFLGPFLVLQPVPDASFAALMQMKKNGWIDTLVLENADDQRLLAAFAEFKNWGGLHHGAEKSLKAAFEAGFYQQSFVSQIRADILKTDAPKDASAAAGTPDPEFLARLFLLMAQDFDERQWEVDRDLALSGRREKEMFRRMTGISSASNNGGDPGAELPAGVDPGAYMTRQRLAAWFRVMGSIHGEIPFLVTDSPAVAALMRERVPEMTNIRPVQDLSGRSPELAKQAFYQMLSHLAETPWAGGEGAGAVSLASGGEAPCALDLYIVPGCAPADLGRYFIKGGAGIKNHENRYLNTIIGIFTPGGKNYKKS